MTISNVMENLACSPFQNRVSRLKAPNLISRNISSFSISTFPTHTFSVSLSQHSTFWKHHCHEMNCVLSSVDTHLLMSSELAWKDNEKSVYIYQSNDLKGREMAGRTRWNEWMSRSTKRKRRKRHQHLIILSNISTLLFHHDESFRIKFFTNFPPSSSLYSLHNSVPFAHAVMSTQQWKLSALFLERNEVFDSLLCFLFQFILMDFHMG